MIEPRNNEPEEAPPVFGSWRRLYWFVAIFFVVEVILLYLFNRYFA